MAAASSAPERWPELFAPLSPSQRRAVVRALAASPDAAASRRDDVVLVVDAIVGRPRKAPVWRRVSDFFVT